jgi:hypothetical protein
MKIERKNIRLNTVKNLIKKDIITDDTKKHFMDNQLDQGDEKYWRYGVLRNYENLYTAVIPKNNKLLKDLNINCSLIVSYMVIHKEWGKEYRFIELIDTFYISNNLGFIMIEAYMKQFKKKVIPVHIIPTSVNYWKKFLYKYYNIETKEEYENFIKENNLLNYKNIISWNYLLETL